MSKVTNPVCLINFIVEKPNPQHFVSNKYWLPKTFQGRNRGKTAPKLSFLRLKKLNLGKLKNLVGKNNKIDGISSLVIKLPKVASSP